MSKVKRIILHPSAFQLLMKQDYSFQVTKGVPDGTKVIGIHQDLQNNTVVLFVEHDSFDEVPDGSIVPELEIWFTRNN